MPSYEGVLNLSVKVNDRQIRALQLRLARIKHGLPKAVSRGINQTAEKAKTKIIDEVHNQTTIAKPAIKAGMRLHKATYRNWAAEIVIKGKRIPLSKFGVRVSPTTHNISYQITKSRGRQTITYDKITNRVYKQKLPSGHVGVWYSKFKSRKMIQRYGPSIPHAYDTTPELSRDVQEDIRKQLWKNINRIAKGLADGTIKK